MGFPFGQNLLYRLGPRPFSISLFGATSFLYDSLTFGEFSLGVSGRALPTQERNVHLSPQLGSLFIARVLLACRRGFYRHFLSLSVALVMLSFGKDSRKRLVCLAVPAVYRHGPRSFGQRTHRGDFNRSPHLVVVCNKRL